MQLINSDNKIVPISVEIKKETRKIDFEFQQLCLELEPTYGKLIWTLPHKVGITERKLRDGAKICKTRGIEKFAYLVGVIKKLK